MTNWEAKLREKDRIIANQAQTISILEERLRQAKPPKNNTPIYPREWGLTGQQENLLTELYLAYPRPINGIDLIERIPKPKGGEGLPIVQTVMCRVRRKIPKSIQIETIRSVGYVLTSKAKEQLSWLVPKETPR